MPRDLAGNYALPSPLNPVVTGTTITTTWWNTTGGDLATAMSASLDRTGTTGGMTGQLKLVDGSSGAPGVAFGSEQTTGLYRATAGEVDLAVLGQRISRWASATWFQTSKDNGATWLNPVYNTESATLVGASTMTGTGGGLGLTVGSTAANIDVEKVNGYLDFSGATNPAATTGFANRLTPKNIVKAYVSAFINAGTVTVHDAFNVQAGGSWTLTALLGYITIPFATAMANTNYIVVGNAQLGQPEAFYVRTKSTGSVQVWVAAFASPGSPVDPTTSQMNIDLMVIGAQ